MALIDVQHQPNAHQGVQRALRSHRVPHAYLFHGPDGVGKELFAKGLAQTLLCPTSKIVAEMPASSPLPAPFRDACGSCEDCRAVAAGNHPDFHLIFRQLNRQHPDPTVRKRTGLDLGVDVIRHFVIDAVGLTPIRSQAKVFVIREADGMTPQAQNALLKTLEEPPNRTYIILLSSSLDGLLATTQSRCQVVRFDLLPADFVASVIQRHLAARSGASLNVESATAKPQPAAKRSTKTSPEQTLPQKPVLTVEQMRWYAQIAQGSAGTALDFLAADLFTLNGRVLATLDRLLNSGSEELAKQWHEEAKTLSDFFSKQDPEISDSEATRRALKTIFFLAATYFDDLLHIMSDQQIGITNADRSPVLKKLANRSDRRDAADRIRRLALAERQLDQNANTQLILDCLAADLEMSTVTNAAR